MKQQVSTPLAVGIIAVLVIVIGYFIFNKTTHPYSGGDAPKPPMGMSAAMGSQPMSAPGGKPAAGINGMGMGGGGSTPMAPPGAPGGTPGGMMAPPPGGMTAPGSPH